LPGDANAALPGDANAALPGDANAALPGDANTALPGDANTALPGDANAALPGDANAALPGDANTAQPAGANASQQAGDNATLPGETGIQQMIPDNSGIPGDTAAQQATGLPGDTATNSVNAAPAGKTDANIMFNADTGNGAPQQALALPKTGSFAKEKEHYVFPKYKAIPMTNELRVMDSKTGELGQTDSLKRYMDWRVVCSSQMKKKHKPSNTADLNAQTAWVTRKGDNGIGESLTLVFDPIYFAAIQEGEINSVKITGLKIINGYNKSHDDWFNNSRVRTMKIYHNKKAFCDIELYDTTNWQEIKFKKPMIIKPGDKLKAVITDYFEGYKYPNACITEFLPVGRPNGTVVGADYMDGKSKSNIRNGGMYD
jgi:hypothetical protein